MRAPDFWSRDGLAAGLLTPLSVAYGLCIRPRSRRRATSCGLPVVCVGNLVAGGAGKTPVAMALAENLQSRGKAAHFLSRGYGGRARGPLKVDPRRHDAQAVGDEPLLLARLAPTWVGADRLASAAAAKADGAEVVIMDDGYQNHRIAKDLALLVIDGPYGLGNGRLLPAGPLRETLESGLERADAIVIIGQDYQDLASSVEKRLPVLSARLDAGPEGRKFSGRKVLAFAGIGRPQKFFDTLTEIGATIAASHGYPDHHLYRPDETAALLAEAKQLDAVPVTTEKDYLRLPPEDKNRFESLPVRLVWRDPSQIDGLLEGGLSHGRG